MRTFGGERFDGSAGPRRRACVPRPAVRPFTVNRPTVVSAHALLPHLPPPPPPPHRGAAPPRARDVRSRRRSSCCRCSCGRARACAQPVGSMPGVIQTSVDELLRDASAAADAGRRRRAAVRHPRAQGRDGIGGVGRRGPGAAGRARAQARGAGAGRDHRRLHVRVHRPRALRRAARTATWTTTRRSSCSRARRCRTRAPAPTSWRRAT